MPRTLEELEQMNKGTVNPFNCETESVMFYSFEVLVENATRSGCGGRIVKRLLEEKIHRDKETKTPYKIGSQLVSGLCSRLETMVGHVRKSPESAPLPVLPTNDGETYKASGHFLRFVLPEIDEDSGEFIKPPEEELTEPDDLLSNVPTIQ